MQPDLRFKPSGLVKALRATNKVLKMFRQRTSKVLFVKDGMRLHAMCSHIWRAIKEGAEWLDSFGLQQGNTTDDFVSVSQALVESQRVVPSVSGAVKVTTLPGWLIQDLEDGLGQPGVMLPVLKQTRRAAQQPAPAAPLPVPVRAVQQSLAAPAMSQCVPTPEPRATAAQLTRDATPPAAAAQPPGGAAHQPELVAQPPAAATKRLAPAVQQLSAAKKFACVVQPPSPMDDAENLFRECFPESEALPPASALQPAASAAQPPVEDPPQSPQPAISAEVKVRRKLPRKARPNGWGWGRLGRVLPGAACSDDGLRRWRIRRPQRSPPTTQTSPIAPSLSM